METQKAQRAGVGKIIIDVIAWIFVIFAAVLTILIFSSQANGGVPNFFNNIPVTIQSGSMSPTFNKGDMIFDTTVTPTTLKKGDVITFWTIIEGKRVMNTHRIVNIKSDGGFVTRGDANSKDDKLPVYSADVIGKYNGTKAAGLGNVMNFFQSSMAFLFCVVLPLALFFLYQVYRFIVVIISIKKPKISVDEEEEIKKKAVEEYLKAQEQSEQQSSEQVQSEENEE